MNTMFIILGIIVYLLIGGVCAVKQIKWDIKLNNEMDYTDYLAVSCLGFLTWPFLLLFMFFAYILSLFVYKNK